MSLINQMLKDLDARHAAELRDDLHREVRALPAAPSGNGGRYVLAAVVGLGLAGGGWLAYERIAAAPAVGPASPVAATAPAVAAVPPASPAVTSATAIESSPTVATPPPAVLAEGAPATVAVASEATAAAVPPAASAAAVPATSPSPALTLALAPTLASVPAVPSTPARTIAAPPPAPASVRATDAAPVVADPVKARPLPAPTPAPALGPTSTGAAVAKTPPVKSVRERAEADFQRAVALVNGARTGEATDLLLDVLRQDGGHVPSRQLLTRLLIEQGRADEAMALLAEGLVAQPGQIQWAMSLARLQVDRGDLAGAARTLQNSRQFGAASADYQGFSGFVAHRLGRQPEATEHYLAATRLSPSEGRWWLGLGLSLEAGQRNAEAREAFARARASGTLNADLLAIVDQKLR
ncbi:MAG TPA: tetratricopeptide repeat protein [Azospira sp.]|nr:tetratricopeptide repeat protein [Azospira sp.]